MTSLASRRSGQVVSLSLVTGGSGYSDPPAITISGGGGQGAEAVAMMAGTRVESVFITNGGTGYTSEPAVVISGNAAATARVYSGPLRPASFFRSRFNDMYAIDGMGRGLRWNGSDGRMQPIGIARPSTGPSVSAITGTSSNGIGSIDILRSGAGYSSVPAVTLTGGSPTTQATALATVKGGHVASVRVTNPGAGYSSAPKVAFAGGCAAGCKLSVGVVGSLYDMQILAGGTGYTAAPTVTLSSAQGLTQANAVATVIDGSIVSVAVMAAGTGATTTGVTAAVTGGGGSGASLRPVMRYSVKAVTVTTAGTGFYATPTITFQPNPADTSFSAAAATSTINDSGNVTGVTVTSGGVYTLPPTAEILDGTAIATASMQPQLKGKYKCCIRYLDDTPKSQRGPMPSSISDLVEVDAGAGVGSIRWSFTHRNLEARVRAMELWRTTSEQSVVLYRVATLKTDDPQFYGAYFDSVSDEKLQDTSRDGYGLMPVTLPSGQINARRFEVPPAHYGVAVMFQDRAWYAVDTTGESPNSLLFSEVDEPESVPVSNELVVQESIGDSDAIVALIPLSSALIIAQSRHLYKLQYVAQPIIDASVLLCGYRGILNARCWDVFGGVAFIADSAGVYAFDGGSEQAISAPVDDLWRNKTIDFSRADDFHLKVDPVSKVVRFYCYKVGDGSSGRALCYCIATKAWWEEEYPYAITAAGNMEIAGRQDVVFGTASGSFSKFDGYQDGGSAVPYRMRTGCMLLANADKGSRSVSLLYTPTPDAANLNLALHYNGSPNPRPSAIATNRGDGFTTAAGATQATLNMRLTRSQLGDASGFARAYFSGAVEERSAGSDRHIAVSLSGQQSSAGNAVQLHGMTVEGAVDG